MALGLLYSGGKDSALAALYCDRFYDVTLVTGHFGVTDDWTHARESADALGFPFERLELDRDVAEAAAARIREDGYPRNGIQRVHEHALERLAAVEFETVGEFDTVADGTRRDDRVPALSRGQARSLEDRHGVDYVTPLAGFGRGAVDRLVERELEVTAGPSEAVPRADYEAELRALITDAAGPGAIDELFPAHEQTVVTGRR